MLIYKVTNLINNKIYIGQTVKSLEQRGLIYRVSDIRSFSREYNLSNRQLRKIAQYEKGKHKDWQSFLGF